MLHAGRSPHRPCSARSQSKEAKGAAQKAGKEAQKATKGFAAAVVFLCGVGKKAEQAAKKTEKKAKSSGPSLN